MTTPNLEAATKAYADFLRALGMDEQTPNVDIQSSAENTAILMMSWMHGLHEPRPSLSPMPAPSREIVSLKTLPFYSFCAHHFVPFFGTVQIDFIPDKFIAGLGGFIRIIDFYSHRPQFQEDLCHQICEHIFQDLKPKGIKVTLNARQMCLELHGKGNQIEISVSDSLGEFPA